MPLSNHPTTTTSGLKAIIDYNRAMNNPTPPSQAIKVAVIAFDGITPFHLSVPSLVFGSVADPETIHFEVRICALDIGALRTSDGFSILIEQNLSILDEADLVIMPSWHSDLRATPSELLGSLRIAHQRGAKVAGLCLGAFPLAEAGLLNGKSATTHWLATDGLATNYPEITVRPEVLYVDEGDVLTSGGVAAGLDCCLHILREMVGAEIANRIARRLLVAPHRDGGQAQFIERPLPVSNSDNRLSQVLDWVIQHLDQAHSVDSLAERAVMSRRNFTRHFRQLTGTSFKQWLLNQRLSHAQHLLESTDASIEAVAQEVGFGTGLSLRLHFQRAYQVSPSNYRKLFRGE